MDSKEAGIDGILQELRQTPTVVDVLLLGRDGDVMAPGRGGEARTGRFSAAVASITGKGGDPLAPFRAAGPESAVVRGKECALIAVDAGPRAVLMVLVDDPGVVDELKELAELKAGRIKGLLG